MGAAAPQGKAHLGGRDTCVSALGSSRSCEQSGRSWRWLGERDFGATVLPCGATWPGARCVDGLRALKGTGWGGLELEPLSHRFRDSVTPAGLAGARVVAAFAACRQRLPWIRRAERRGLLATGALRRSTRTDPTKRNSGLGGGGGNTQAAVRTKRQQTGRRGGTPSTCCLVALSCRVRTSQ
jgi:hypothetical protein